MNIFYSSLCLFLSAICIPEALAQQTFEIKGRIESDHVVDSIFIYEYGKPKGSSPIASAAVLGNQFLLKGTIEQPSKVTIRAKDIRKTQELYLEQGKFDVVLRDGWDQPNLIIGGEQNALVKAYERDSRQFADSLMALAQGYEKASDKEKLHLNEQMSKWNSKLDEVRWSYIRMYPTSIAVLDIFSPYIQVMNFQTLEQLLRLCSPDLSTTHTYVQLLQKHEEKKLEQLVGNQAPEFKSKTDKGKSFQLSQLKGKVVLLDFWASWCVPCRAGNKALKPLYEKYKDKGVEFVSFSMDNKEKLWKDAIQADGIPWVQVSDLQDIKVNKTAQLYHIQALPTIYLIDEDGKVVAQNINKEELTAWLENRFK